MFREPNVFLQHTQWISKCSYIPSVQVSVSANLLVTFLQSQFHVVSSLHRFSEMNKKMFN